MRSIRISVFGILMLSFIWAQNPIQNAGFESGLENWKVHYNALDGWGSESHASLDSATANSGTYFVELGVGNGGGASGYSVAFQKVAADYSYGQKAVLTAFIKDNGETLAGGDFAGLKLEFYDGADKIAEKEVIQTGVTATWQEFTMNYLIPFGTDSISAVLVATRWDGGGAANYGFDDVTLSYAAGESPDVTNNVTVVLEEFDVLDTAAWKEDGEGTVTATLDDSDFAQGYGAIDIKYVIPSLHGWGSFVAYQNMPDENKASFDISIGETLSVWLKVEEAPARPDTVLFRIQITDMPPGATSHEMYAYENLTALDSVRDWFEIKAPLVQRATDGATIPNEEGFVKVPNDWGQPSNDDVLNFESIRSIEFDFVTSGWDPAANLPADSGKVSIDFLTLKGNKGVDVAYFNGVALSALASETFGWGQSTVEVVEDATNPDGTNSVKWIQGNEWNNGWSGAGFNLSDAINYTPRWFKDSLKFSMNTEASTPSIKFQFESGSDGKAYYDLTPEAAGGWNDYAIALKDFVLDGAAANFDTSAVTVLGFMANGNAVVGRTIYFGSMVTGNPAIDVIGPDAVGTISAVGGDYFNTVTWVDVEGETGEIYNIYASKYPIDSLTQSTVDVVAKGVKEGIGEVIHWIYTPGEDATVDYYYAIECIDAAGNIGEYGLTANSTSNTAKGVPTISLNVPSVTIDGDISEWFDSGIKPFYISPEKSSWGVGKVSAGTVTDSLDASATFFVAIDTAYLYVAAEVTDNDYDGYTGTPSGNLWWEHDVFELFIGLFDQRGARGGFGDNHFKFVFNQVGFWTEFASSFKDTIGSNYAFQAFDPDYAFEAMIPLDSIAGDNDRFVPVAGYRIIMEPTIHDKDVNWEGNVAASATNADNAWQTPNVWSVTWLGDRDGTLDVPVNNVVPLQYSLQNNFPNPFNPVTNIQYSIPEAGNVRLTVFNLLGEEVMTLVDEIKPAGVHNVQFSGRNLASGMYFYKIETTNFVKSKKMLLLK